MSQRITLSIDGMNCEHCVGRVKEALAGVSGVSDVEVDLESGEATLAAADHVSREQLVEAVGDAGYKVPNNGA